MIENKIKFQCKIINKNKYFIVKYFIYLSYMKNYILYMIIFKLL